METRVRRQPFWEPHWPALFAVPLAAMAALCLHYAFWMPDYFRALVEPMVSKDPGLERAFSAGGTYGIIAALAEVMLPAAIGLVIAALAAFLRRPIGLSVVRKGFVIIYVLYFVYAYIVFGTTEIILNEHLVKLAHEASQKNPAVIVFFWRWELAWPATLILLGTIALHLASWRGRTLAVYGARPPARPPGDWFFENVRTHGAEPAYRKGLLGSASVHIFFLALLPWLLTFGGCVEPYRVPKGRGNPVVAYVQMVKPQKKKKQKKYILNPNSPIDFNLPDLEDSKVLGDVERMSQDTYRAGETAAMGGKMGSGGKGPGGFIDGMEGGEVRFIRLQYDGLQWDDGMDRTSGADINFLKFFKDMSGLKVREHGEAHPIRSLKSYEKGFAPPFVYMTGVDRLNVSQAEVLALRQYLLDGGMLWADCGGPRWDGQFRQLARALFPDEPLRVIADDDPIFKMPFGFPNGAPPLWHHGGWRALGVKLRGRWVVFYHPGDMNDAWKHGGSGLDPAMARMSYELGVNVVYYSFVRYLELTRKYRK